MTFLATDRCDRCGAQAYASATLPTGRVLMFCGHHWRKHGPALIEAGATVTDETGNLTAPALG